MKITFHSSAIIALIGTPTKAKGLIRTSIADSCPLTVRFLHFCPFHKTSFPLKVIYSAQRVPEPDPLPVTFYSRPDSILKVIGKQVTQNIGYYPMFQVNPKFQALPDISGIPDNIRPDIEKP